MSARSVAGSVNRRGRRGEGTRRPWRVFVFDIGPSFSFADESKARALAERLVSGEEFTYGSGAKGGLGSYGRVMVTERRDVSAFSGEWERTIYTPEGSHVERLHTPDGGTFGWHRVSS